MKNKFTTNVRKGGVTVAPPAENKKNNEPAKKQKSESEVKQNESGKGGDK